MKPVCPRALSACVCLSAAATSSADGVYVGVGVGGADAQIEGPFFSDGTEVGDSSSDALVVGELALGYEWPTGALVEVSIQGYDTFNLLGIADALDYDTIRLGAGYNVPSDSKFELWGKGGLVLWDLKARESFFFNPGPEEVRRLDGTDWFLGAGLDFRFNDTFRLGLSFEHANLDVGDTTSAKLLFKISP